MDWIEALPLGNGRLGAMVFGDARHERVQLNEDTLWSGEPVEPADFNAWKSLEAVRNFVFAGQYAEATEAAKPIQGPFTQSYLPLGDLWLDFNGGEEAAQEVTEYQRTLNLDTATIEISYRIHDVVYHRSLFISAPDRAIIIRLTASRPGSLSLGVSLSSPLQSTTVNQGQSCLLLAGRAPRHVEPKYCSKEPAVLYDDAEDGKGMRFAAILRAVVDGGSMESSSGTLSIDSADTVTLYVAAATSFSGFDRSPRCCCKVTTAASISCPHCQPPGLPVLSKACVPGAGLRSLSYGQAGS